MTKLQLLLGVAICVLIYKHMTAPKAAPEVTMDMVQSQSATLDSSAKAQANQIMNSGDIEQIESQMNSLGLLQ